MHQCAVVLDGCKLLGVFRPRLAIRLAHGEQVADAKAPGAAQDWQAVIDKQAARRCEADVLLQGVPELLVFLGEAVVVGADQPVEVRC